VRKETVRGFLSPDRGLVKVHAPRPGVVGDLQVTEGSVVAPGDVLLTLRGRRLTEAGIAVDMQMLDALEAQLQEIEKREILELQRREGEVERLHAELLGLQAEQDAIDGQVRIQRLLLKSLQKKGGRLRQLLQNGYVSDDELAAQKEKLLVGQQSLANLAQKKVLNTNRARQIQLQLERIPVDSNRRVSELNSLRADLSLKKAEQEARQSVSVSAPIAGTVTALRAITGTSVDTRLPLLTILPAGAKLEAQLFVPSRAIGFVAVEQEVRLLYDAFDYRRFGVHTGRVSGVSSAVFAPQETPSGVQVSEPSYRVTVQLQSQQFAAYGEHFPLQAGMTLRADIVLEERSLFEWLMDPLLALRGRT
jgi:membrane fusion protein